MKKINQYYKLPLVLFLILIISCNNDYTPKPRGYMKVDYPAKTYHRFEDTGPFSFDIPDYTKITPDTAENAEAWWYNLYFKPFDATIFLTYKAVNDNLNVYIEDSRQLVYKHTIMADDIPEELIFKPEIPVYGILYDIKGNTASSLQFFITDSIKHFIRGSLYFNVSPEKDSLAPIIEFIREDIEKLIETVEWDY